MLGLRVVVRVVTVPVAPVAVDLHSWIRRQWRS